MRDSGTQLLGGLPLENFHCRGGRPECEGVFHSASSVLRLSQAGRGLPGELDVELDHAIQQRLLLLHRPS